MKKRQMVIIIIVLAVISSLVVTILYLRREQQDKINYDCYGFKSQKAAQAYFVQQGGSAKKNIDNLDADHDGVACQSYNYEDFTLHFLEDNPDIVPTSTDGPTFEDIAEGRGYINPACLDSNGEFDVEYAVANDLSCFSFQPYR